MTRVEPSEYYCDYAYLIGIGGIPEGTYEWKEGVLYLHDDLQRLCQEAWKRAEATQYRINPVEAYIQLVKEIFGGASN